MPIDPLDAPHLEKLKPWITKANALIDSKIEDVRAHAERSLTRGVIDAPEGRSTWRMLKRQTSAKAAQRRLDALLEHLVGGSDQSFSGFVQDARAKFYEQSFQHWKNQIPKSVLDPKAVPKSSGELKARGLVIFGLSPRQELAPVFLTASNSLKTAMNAAAITGTTEKQQDVIFDTWEANTQKSLKRKIEGMLSDSQIAIISLVGREMVKSEFRAEKK